MSTDQERLEAALDAGADFEGHLARVTQHRDALAANLAAFTADDDALAPFRREEPLRLLAIVEEWTSEVIASLPAIVALGRRTGAWRERIVIGSDGWGDLVARFPDAGGRAGIPVYVLVDPAEPRVVAHLAGRRDATRGLVDVLVAQALSAFPDADPARLGETLTEEQGRAFTVDLIRLRADYAPTETAALIDELASALGLPAASRS